MFLDTSKATQNRYLIDLADSLLALAQLSCTTVFVSLSGRPIIEVELEVDKDGKARFNMWWMTQHPTVRRSSKQVVPISQEGIDLIVLQSQLMLETQVGLMRRSTPVCQFKPEIRVSTVSSLQQKVA